MKNSPWIKSTKHFDIYRNPSLDSMSPNACTYEGIPTLPINLEDASRSEAEFEMAEQLGSKYMMAFQHQFLPCKFGRAMSYRRGGRFAKAICGPAWLC
ncbi:hypothetical protein E2562_007890 [Oryza meyeriana var. granulata]|uniref:Uncharacterized protein n=1 Tax=Oryza meyeriana var. granulata TaxID=110450 RepID=A0A6G1DY45_9ORYZ|nr:hypothetical protein E2562_007890 [Oryza meyeriana var. granulata]KAF0916601.1 hypothetical protein E2562_007890 [Oryza meyeriana var. granulata]KAF0916602.1 hypothetical protein E2562_007890 [Oryza meyeriana var. granulata]KAF0916603.1 hypothetical protein E2562_007890 [Oryza meyeriana var. granulata]